MGAMGFHSRFEWYAQTMHIKVVNDMKAGRTANVLYDRIKNREMDLMT